MKSMTHKRNGGALIIVMFIVMLFLIAGTGLLSLSEKGRLIAIRSSQDMASRICADAGIEAAVGEMNTRLANGTLDDSDLPMSVGETLPATEGAFSYKVDKVDGNYVAVSIGARGNFQRIIQAKIRRKSCFEYGVVARGQLNFPPNSTAKAYDSQNASAAGLEIQMGTLSTTSLVVTKPGSSVIGDLFVGVGGNPASTISVGGTLTGTKYALTEAPEIYQPAIPAGLPAKPDLHTNGTTVTVTPANSGVYANFCVDNGGGNIGKLVISGGTVTMAVTNFMKLDNSAEIVVNVDSTLLLYVACNISSMAGASISYDGSPMDPSHIQIYGTGTGSPQTWAIKAKNAWTGVIYAPNANISMQAGQNFYGAIFGNYVGLDIQSGYSFNYDVNLQRATNIVLGGDFVTKRWSESSSEGIPGWAN